MFFRAAAEYASPTMLKLLALIRRREPNATGVFAWFCLLLWPAHVLGGGAAPFREHPRVLLDEAELATLRRQVVRRGWKHDLYYAPRDFAVTNPGQGIRLNAALWLKREIEIPARGGHFHQFFCVDGDRLELPKDQRFVPGPYRCLKCGREYSGEQYEAALRRMVHGWLAEAALDLALVGTLERKADYCAKSTEILLKYAAAYPGPHTSLTAGGMIYQSLDEAMWVLPLAEAHDLDWRQVPAANRARIEAFLRTVAQGLRACDVRGNWESWHLSAVGVVGYALGDRELVNWATERFRRQIRDELGRDGLWPESVHIYHYFPLLAFMHLAEAAWHNGLDLYRWEAQPGKSLLNMFSAPLAYAYPDLRLPAINDGWFEAFIPADDYELAWHRTHDPRFAWVLVNGYRPGIAPAGRVPASTREARRDGFYAFLFGGDLPSRVTPPPKKSSNFPGLGICILRSTNDAMLTFDYGPFLGHGQFDKMGITLFANGRLWMADYGTPGYGAAILPWYQSTPAHNTMVVDDRNQKRTSENAVKLRLGGTEMESAESETQQAYPGVTHKRIVMRVEDCFVIVDRLESVAEHTYDFYLHSEGELRFEPAAEHVAAEDPGSSLESNERQTESVPAAPTGQWLEGITPVCAGEQVSGRWTEGDAGVAFTCFGSGQITAFRGRCPAESGSRKVPLFIARQSGKQQSFVTVLCPYRGAPSVTVARVGDSLQLRCGRVTRTVPLESGIDRVPARP